MVPLRVIRLALTAPKAVQPPRINLQAVKHPSLGSTTLGISGCLEDSPAAQMASMTSGSSIPRLLSNGHGSVAPRVQQVLPEITEPKGLRPLPMCPERGGCPPLGATPMETSGSLVDRVSTPPATARSATFGRTP